MSVGRNINHEALPLISIQSWRQTVYIQPNGDVREVLNIEAVALREPVYFIRLTAGSRWDQPEKYRRNVKVAARNVTVDGNMDAYCGITTLWSSSQKLTSFLHFPIPIKRGEQILFEMVRTWPAKCQPLMIEGTAESFIFRSTQLLDIQHVHYRIVLPAEFNARAEPVSGSSAAVTGISIETTRDDEGREMIVWNAYLVRAHEAVGVRLELSNPIC
jgi:hypothetical protein